MKILALDLATVSGWAFNYPDTNGGVWNLKPKTGSSSGMKLIKLRSQLQGFLDTVGTIDLITYEKPAGRFINGVISVSELVAVLKMFCSDNKIEYTSYRPKEIKKFATGKGNANKDMMFDTAKAKWPSINVIDNNQADAMWLLELTKSEYL